MRPVRGIHALRRPRNIHHANPDIICMVVQVPGIHVKMSDGVSELGWWYGWCNGVLQ